MTRTRGSVTRTRARRTFDSSAGLSPSVIARLTTRDAANTDPDEGFWTAQERNVDGQLANERYGNGVFTGYEYR